MIKNKMIAFICDHCRKEMLIYDDVKTILILPEGQLGNEDDEIYCSLECMTKNYFTFTRYTASAYYQHLQKLSRGERK